MKTKSYFRFQSANIELTIYLTNIFNDIFYIRFITFGNIFGNCSKKLSTKTIDNFYGRYFKPMALVCFWPIN